MHWESNVVSIRCVHFRNASFCSLSDTLNSAIRSCQKLSGIIRRMICSFLTFAGK
jgi:hypothetical protein